MGLPRAVQAHKQGDLPKAEQHYKRALEQGVRTAVLFQNYGALLRSLEKFDQASAMYAEGRRLHPEHIGLITNNANLVQEKQPASALSMLLQALRLKLRDAPDQELQKLMISIVALLRQLGQLQWALSMTRLALQTFGPTAALVMHCLLLQDQLEESSNIQREDDVSEALRRQLESHLQDSPPLERGEMQTVLATHYLSKRRLSRAESLFEEGIKTLSTLPSSAVDDEKKVQKLIDTNSWNYSITLLKQQQLQRGWTLFEHGLRTPAPGQQRWQRALSKPFSAARLPLWRGEALHGKRLLLLEEQAVGDAMMFATLVPTLLEEAAEIGLVFCDRLLPIYQRSFSAWIEAGRVKVWGYKDARDGSLDPAHYDLQSPIGSICRHRFSGIETYGQHLPLLKTASRTVADLRHEYLSQGRSAQRLIGISWRGGGKGDRIRQKSIDPDAFRSVIQDCPGVRFVSLQYGKAAPAVEEWLQQGVDMVLDPRVDPLKNMDVWLAQVAACDAVLSVANTTIHGAGGLNLPTLCLLSRYCDWRWFKDPSVTRSYWYPSVGIARESEQSGWDDAFAEARRWILNGCPMPTGPLHTGEQRQP